MLEGAGDGPPEKVGAAAGHCQAGHWRTEIRLWLQLAWAAWWVESVCAWSLGRGWQANKPEALPGEGSGQEH